MRESGRQVADAGHERAAVVIAAEQVIELVDARVEVSVVRNQTVGGDEQCDRARDGSVDAPVVRGSEAPAVSVAVAHPRELVRPNLGAQRQRLDARRVTTLARRTKVGVDGEILEVAPVPVLAKR